MRVDSELLELAKEALEFIKKTEGIKLNSQSEACKLALRKLLGK